MDPIRVVVADDHPVWVRGMRAELGDGFEVVGEAGTAAQAVEVIRATTPDLVVCDLQMPGGGALTVAAHCATETRIVVLSVSEAERDVLDAVAAGAVGYLVKTTPVEELRAELRRAAAGTPVFSANLAALVVGEFQRLARASGASPLSAREREVLGLVAQGLTYSQIGGELFISPKTVDNHIRNTLAKLHLSRREELVRYAIERRIT